MEPLQIELLLFIPTDEQTGLLQPQFGSQSLEQLQLRQVINFKILINSVENAAQAKQSLLFYYVLL